MKPPRVLLALLDDSTPATGTARGLLLADARLFASETIPGLPRLMPSIVPGSADSGCDPGPSARPLPGCPFPALLGETTTAVDALVSSDAISVEASGFGEVSVSSDGRRLAWCPADDEARRRPELILGPGLVLALAFRGIFCLHASAVLTPLGAVLFAGPSGAGKSTLAARISAQHGFPRLADDITPIRVGPDGAFVLPHFPQLKLPPEGQYAANAPVRHPLARLYLLSGCLPDESVREEPVSASAAGLAVCAQTVASRLFPERLMADLLRASGAIVENAAVQRLHYPKTPSSVRAVARLLNPS